MAITVGSGTTSTVNTNLSGPGGTSFIILSGGAVVVSAGGATSGDVLSGGYSAARCGWMRTA